MLLAGGSILERQRPKNQVRLKAVTACLCLSVPNFLVGNELFFGKDRLKYVKEEIGKHRLQDAWPTSSESAARH